MAAGNQTRRILIKVDTSEARGLREIAQQMGLLNDRTKSLSGNMNFLTSAFKGWLGFLGVREVARMSDEMQNLGNRIKVIAQEGEDTNATMERLLAVADRTNQPLRNVAETYARMGVSMKEIKPSAESLLSLTETLINTFRLSGSTTTETVNTIIQLSQAFASAELRGQELRSVMEQNAFMGIMLRKTFGQDIYDKARKGMVTTAEVLKLLSQNMQQINKDALQLTPTIEQTVAKAFNRLQFAIHNLNQGLGVSSAVAKGLDFVTNNLGAFSAILLAVAVGSIPTLVTALGNLAVGFVSLNPLILSTAVALTGVIALFGESWDASTLFTQLKAGFSELEGMILGLRASFHEFWSSLIGGESENAFDKLAKKLRQAEADAKAHAKALWIEHDAAQALREMQAKQVGSFQELIDKQDQLGKKAGKAAKLREELALLNVQFLRDKDIEKYVEAFNKFELDKINRQFKEGRMDVFKYHEQLRDFNIRQFTTELNSGAITLDEFNKTVGAEKFKVLKEQVEAGRISLEQYNAELAKLEDKIRPGNAIQLGLSNYIKSVGTISEGVAKSIEQTFGHLEKSFIDFIKTGKFNFRDFANAVLDDLNKIIVRSLIIRPLAQGILDMSVGSASGSGYGSAGGSYTATGTFAAKGMAFDRGNVVPFRKGGIVDSPVGFTFGGGRKGVMGEAGPEAILPLKRSGSGDLGVAAQVTPVTVNIINQTGSEVESIESTGPNGERQIDILITSKVREGISTGKFDTAMKAAFGIRRRGS